MTATVFRQSYMTQRPSLFTLINYCAIVFSFALIFANGWLTACYGFYEWCFCLLAESHETINHWPLLQTIIQTLSLLMYVNELTWVPCKGCNAYNISTNTSKNFRGSLPWKFTMHNSWHCDLWRTGDGAGEDIAGRRRSHVTSNE